MPVMRHILRHLSTVVLLALAGCGAEPPDSGLGDDIPPLLIAAEQGDLPGIEALLQKRPLADVRDSCDWTPLMKAALNGHTEAVARLLEAGAAVDARDKGGYTALLLAASNDHAGVVRMLLEQGAMVDHQELTKGWTALIWAAKLGHGETVDELLTHGADRTLRDFSGRTAAAWAREEGHTRIAARLEGPTRATAGAP